MNFVYLQKSQKLILIRPISSKNSKKGKEVRMENYIEVKVAEYPERTGSYAGRISWRTCC